MPTPFLTLLSESPCQQVIDLDNSQIASLYSQLAGVLAGFAFTAVTVVVTVRVSATAHGHSFDDSLRLLIAAFLGLVLTSLNYAAIAGDKTQGARSTLLEIVAGLGFAASALLLIYAVLLMLIATRTSSSNTGSTIATTDIEAALRLTLVVVLPMIVLVFLYVGARDQQLLSLGQRDAFGGIDVLAAILGLLQLAVGLIAWKKSPAVAAPNRSKQVKIYSSTFLSIAFAGSVATAMITSLMEPCASVSLLVPAAVLTASTAAMIFTSIHIADAM